jgi:hypothetical protein
MVNFPKADMSLAGRSVRRQISFNACDQLRNADRLAEKWMSLDLQWRFYRIPRHSACALVRNNELEVSVAMNAHLHCSRLSYQPSKVEF